jgi:type I restriction enzyme S subunit
MVAPKLRFQEFDGDWESKKLKDLTDILKCGVASTPKYVTEGGYPFLSAQNISRNGEMNYSKVNNISDDFYKKISKTKLLKGDILYSRVGASYGVAAIFDREEEYGVYVSLTQIRVNDTLNNIFLKQFLNSPKARIQAEQGVFQGGGVQNLNVGVVEEFNLTLPSKQEQTKIASFLAAVDEKITQLTQKHQLLSQYKQGMMQKLFSQQIRFKADDGSEFGEWDEYSLDTLLSKIIDNRGKTPVTEANLEIPLIEVNAIGQRRIKYEKVSKYFSEDTFQNWFRAYLEHQDILFSTVGNTAICSIYTDEIKAGIAQNIVGLRANTKLIQPTFLYYLLTEISNNQKFKSIEMQAVQPSIKVSQMIHLTFLTPCLEEQTKIANFLSSIDQKIEVTAQQIEQAKQWKKGLLQQMFV